eukprot:gene13462-biopygen10
MKRSQVQVLVPPRAERPDIARCRAVPLSPAFRRRSGALAQLVERLLCKQDVRSSNLLGSTREPVRGSPSPAVRAVPRSACSGGEVVEGRQDLHGLERSVPASRLRLREDSGVDELLHRERA